MDAFAWFSVGVGAVIFLVIAYSARAERKYWESVDWKMGKGDVG